MQIIFENLNLFAPKEVDDVIKFIDNYASPPLSNFFLVTLPEICKDPAFLIRTMSILKYKKHPINIQYQQEKGAIEKLFDLFLSYLSFPLAPYGKDFWEVHLMLCDLLVTFLCKNLSSILLVESQISYLHAKLLKLIQDAPPYTALPFIRLMIHLHKATLSRAKPEVATKRLTNLFNAVPSGTPGHAYVARFVSKDSEKYIQRKKLIQPLYSQGFFNTWDVQFMGTISPFIDAESSLISAQILAKTMCLNWCYSRLAAYCLSRLLYRTTNTNIVSDWFVEFLTQLQIANALQEKQKRYKARRQRVNELLSSDLFMRFDFVVSFFENNDTTSEQFQQTVSEYVAFGPYLKYAPFTTKGLSLFGKGTEKKTGKGKKKGKKGKRSESVPPKEKTEQINEKQQAASDDEENGPNNQKNRRPPKRKPPMKF